MFLKLLWNNQAVIERLGLGLAFNTHL